MTENIRIASYNVRKARGLDQRRRPERTLQVINGLDADIVVLQEADLRMGQRKPALPREMIEQETDFRLVDVTHNGVSLGWHGNVVLAREHIGVSSIRRVALPGLEPRGAVQVDFAVGAGLSVVATHLGLRRRDRQAQLATIANALPQNGHSVIAGDFNEWSAKRGLEPLTDRFQIHAPGKTFHTSRPVAALDRFALSQGVEMRDGGVDQSRLAKLASDHLPIWTDVEVPKAAAIY